MGAIIFGVHRRLYKESNKASKSKEGDLYRN
jgi:hypothetical protein